MMFNAKYVSYIMAVSFIGGGNLDKTTDLSQVTDKLCHIMFYQVHLAISWIQIYYQKFKKKIHIHMTFSMRGTFLV